MQDTAAQESKREGQTVRQLQNRLWAYVDFPTSLVIVGMVLQRQPPAPRTRANPIPSDFYAAMAYLLLVLIGILNIPVNVTDAEIWNNDQQRSGPAGSRPFLNVQTEMCTIHVKKPNLNVDAIRAAGNEDGL